MRLSEFAGKEIINIFDGARLGTVSESDLIINADTGYVESIVLPARFPFISWRGRQNFLVIPWQAVRKIGEQVIVVEMELVEKRRLNS